TQLQSLILHHGRMTTVDLSGLSNLRRLDLVGWRSLERVEGLSGLRDLRTLDLGGCVRLANIDELFGLTTLQTIDLRDCDAIPPRAIAKLRRALPDCSIESGGYG
ncbi:MAG TPA: hypothetical protein QGF58_29330, partial [Myxococcota bacterium]|nr:hypothetical protein [Myxococcota bacterium]